MNDECIIVYGKYTASQKRETRKTTSGLLTDILKEIKGPSIKTKYVKS